MYLKYLKNQIFLSHYYVFGVNNNIFILHQVPGNTFSNIKQCNSQTILIYIPVEYI